MKKNSVGMLGVVLGIEWSGVVEEDMRGEALCEDLAKLYHNGKIEGLMSEYLCMGWSDG